MNKNSVAYNNLTTAVIANSTSKIWAQAVNEWQIIDVEEDCTLSASCICGHPNLRYLFKIQNKTNNNILFPIGSKCIKKFERNELYEEATLNEKLFKLYHAIVDNQFLTFNSDFFSRKLIDYLYKLGAFKPSIYNNYNPDLDHQFLITMFNKKPKKPSHNKRKLQQFY